MTVLDLVHQIREYRQRRRARKADNEMLADIELKEWFFGPMDAHGRRPCNADDIAITQIHAHELSRWFQEQGDEPWER